MIRIKGYYSTSAELKLAYPTSSAGDIAIVGTTVWQFGFGV